MKKLLSLVLATMMALSLVACGGSGDDGDSSGDDTIKVKVGTVMSENAPGSQALMKMRDDLAEQSGGRIEVIIYFGGQLGGELEMIEQARSGDIQMATSNHMNISNTIKPLTALESYFLFDDYDHAFAFQDSEGGQAMLDAYNEMGLQGLGYFPTGFRHFTNNKKALESVEDFKGIKIRGYSEVQIDAWEAVGVVLSAVAWNELFTSMQQSLIDGQESAISSIYEQKFYEVQQYITMTSHLLSSDILVCNQQWMDSLAAEDSAMIQKAIDDAVTYHRENIIQIEADCIATFEEAGVNIGYLTDEVRAELSATINEAVNPTIIKLAGQETFDLIQKSAEETR